MLKCPSLVTWDTPIVRSSPSPIMRYVLVSDVTARDAWRLMAKPEAWIALTVPLNVMLLKLESFTIALDKP